MPEQLTYREAINRALRDAMRRDPAVVALGEDIGRAGGSFKVTEGLFEEFGGERVMDTPISETGFVGAAIGLALGGLRPVVELMFADFDAVAYDQIVNQAAKYLYLSAGQMPVPMVIRTVGGAGLGFASQHSQTTESWYLAIPGLKVVVPSDPQSAYGLLLSAIEDPNPVVYIEHKKLYNRKGIVDTSVPIPIGTSAILRAGADVTIVASLAMVVEALEAAEALATQGIAAEVIDLRTLVPMELDTILASVVRTGRLVVVEEQPLAGGWGGHVVAEVVSRAFDSLDHPPLRVAMDHVPVPFSQALEAQTVPTAERVAAATASMFGG